MDAMRQYTGISGGRKYGKSEKYKLISRDLVRNRTLYLMIVPVLLFYIVFCYAPMYGVLIAFKEYSPGKGILGSDWAGLQYFTDFFTSRSFGRVIKNTVSISLSTLVFGFPAPIVLALLINSLKNKYFARTVQTITYIPHFISLVVICGMIKDFTVDKGLINNIIAFFGGERVTMLLKPALFLRIYVISDIWQSIGWNSIIYLAALSAIDETLYEAAKIDGAGALRQTASITLPCLMPTIVVMLILRIGNMLSVGFEKIILLYNPVIYETSDVISTFVYRKGMQEFNWGFSAAVGLFNSLINFGLLLLANGISRKINETSLW